MFKFLNKVNVLSIALLSGCFFSGMVLGKSSKDARSKQKAGLENKNKLEQTINQLVMYIKQQLDTNNVLTESDLREIIADLNKDEDLAELMDVILNASAGQEAKEKEFMSKEAFWRNFLIGSFGVVGAFSIYNQLYNIYLYLNSKDEKIGIDQVCGSLKSLSLALGWSGLLFGGYKYTSVLSSRGAGEDNIDMNEIQQKLFTIVGQKIKNSIDAKDAKKKQQQAPAVEKNNNTNSNSSNKGE